MYLDNFIKFAGTDSVYRRDMNMYTCVTSGKKLEAVNYTDK